MRGRYETRALTFAYRGIAPGELKAAERIATDSGIEERRVVRLPDLLESGDMGRSFDGLPPTYIPMRNAVFYSLAASYAEESGASFLVGGHNKEDLLVFRDAGREFFDMLQAAFRAGSNTLERRRLTIVRPLERRTKPQVVRLAASMGVPLEHTWSCHSGGSVPCWSCEGCAARERAFDEAGVADPLRGARPPGKV